MKLKNILLQGLSLVLVAALAIGGTVAYLQDDDSDVNVMTLGNVSIAQHEYQRATNEDGTYKTDTIDDRTSYVLEAFEQAKPLYPAIIPNGGTVGGVTWDYDATPVRMSQVDSHGGASVFNTPNAQDKFVTVENTGKTDAYVRTLIALEVGNAVIEDPAYPNQPLISSEIRAAEAADNQNGDQPWTYGYRDYAEIDGNKYLVYELIYTGAMTSSGWKHENGVLPAGATTYPNLCQVYLASRATNEDVEALDGNNNGTYDILVLSQAVQADGWTAADGKHVAEFALDTAFGDVNATNAAAWFGGVGVISVTPDTVQDVLNNAADNAVIQLTAGNYGVLTLAPVYGSETTVLDSTTGNLSRTINGLTIKGADGAKVDGIKVSPMVGDTISLNNVVIDGVTFTGAAEGFWCNDGGATIKNFTMKNCTMTATGANRYDMVCIKSGTPENITITGCTVEGGLRLLAMTPSKNVTVTNNTISNVVEHGILLDNSGGRIHSGTIIVDNNYCYGANGRFIRFANMDDASVIITNNRVHQYKGGLDANPYEDDYIKVTYKDANVTPNVTIYGNEVNCANGSGYPARGDLYISVNGERFVQP